MIRKKMLSVLAGTIVSLSAPAFSQETEAARSDVTVQAFGSFLTTTTNNGVQQSATNSGGVLATYRYFFNNHSGVEANYGYALNTQNYNLAGAVTGLNAYAHEFTAAYVFRLPRKHWTPFVLAGTGGLLVRSQQLTRRQRPGARNLRLWRRRRLQPHSSYLPARRISRIRLQFADFRLGGS